MRNKLFWRGTSIIALIMLIALGQQIVAQTVSTGCTRWSTFTSATIPDPGSVGFINILMNAGDQVSVNFSLDTGTTTGTVSIDSPLGSPVSQTTFGAGTVTLTYTIPADGLVSLTAVNNVASDGDVVVSNFVCVSGITGTTSGASTNSSSAPVGFTDDRINFRDAAAPVAIYSYVDSNGLGFDIYHADGRFAYRATASDLTMMPLYDPVNDIRISAMAGGGYQVTAPQYNGKTYIMQVDIPLANIGYTSYEQD